MYRILEDKKPCINGLAARRLIYLYKFQTFIIAEKNYADLEWEFGITVVNGII